MKTKYIVAVVIVTAFYSFIYFWNQYEKDAKKDTAISSAASKPDDYLLQAKEYESLHRHDKSAYSIEQAILAIWKLERDVNDESFERLEQTIEMLEDVHRRIIRDSVDFDELVAALEFSLGNLARAELEVAEKYSESNKPSQARTALKYAQLHMKNALILHNPQFNGDSIQIISEQMLLQHIDSLLNNEVAEPDQYTMSLDKLIGELDSIINRINR